eukprot:gene12431-biopygen5637
MVTTTVGPYCLHRMIAGAAAQAPAADEAEFIDFRRSAMMVVQRRFAAARDAGIALIAKGSINAASEDTAAATMYGFSDEVPLLGARSGGAARAAAGRASGDLPAPTAGADREPASGDTSADVPFATQSSAQRSRCTLRDHRDATPASGIGAVSVAQQGVRRDAHEARS